MPEATRLAEPPADPVVRTLRARTAAHARHGNVVEAAATRRALELRRIANRVKRLAPLTDVEVGPLADLLRCGPVRGAD